MIKVQQVFDTAINLIDEQDERTGIEDTKEYKFRTISILNSIIPVLYPYSTTWKADVPAPILGKGNAEMGQYVPLSDNLAITVLPPYLAAQLVKPVNDAMAAWFMERYHEALFEAKSNVMGEWEKIDLPYGTF